MSENPYQPTVEMSPPGQSERVYSFKSTATLTNVLSGLLVLGAILSAAVGILDWVGIAMIPGYATGDYELEGVAQFVTLGMVAAGLSSMLVYVLGAILFCVWMYRSNANAHSFGVQGMTVTPGWAVGYWFIPILNLFRPYQAMCEIYRASASPQSNWKAVDVPGFFLPWWLCWVIGNIVAQVETRAALRGLDLGPAALPISVSSTLLSIAAAILAVMVIRRICGLQMALAGSKPAAVANPLTG